MDFRKIAAASDFSEGADLAVAKALELAGLYRAELSVVHVIAPLVSPSPLLDDMALTQASFGLSEDLKESSLAELKKRYPGSDAVKISARVLEGNPAAELAKLAEDEKLDLLVMGSTGLSGLAEVVFGSVAAKTIRRAPCSVMVVRRPRG